MLKKNKIRTSLSQKRNKNHDQEKLCSDMSCRYSTERIKEALESGLDIDGDKVDFEIPKDYEYVELLKGVWKILGCEKDFETIDTQLSF